MNLVLHLKTYLLSLITTMYSPTNMHNKLKFKQIYEILYAIKQDNIEGDYIEFGIFKGKSLYHVWRCINKLNLKNMNLYGLDSFEGFPVENHELYTKENFKTSYDNVNKFFSNKNKVNVVKGFFQNSIKTSKMQEISNVSFAFIDCDIYESSIPIFQYLEERVSLGGFIMIDDFTSIDANQNSIYKAWKENKYFENNFVYYSSYSNGQVFRKVISH